jgi:hypothetical protein
VGAERVYVTIDSWDSREAYDEFRERFAAEYGEIDARCEVLTITERQVS